MKTKHIVVIVVIILLVYLLIKNKEGLQVVSAPILSNEVVPTLSNEAIQSISSVYANTTGTAVFNKLKGKLMSNDSKFIFGFDTSGNLCIYDDKNNKISTIVVKDNSGNINNINNINLTGNINGVNDINATGNINSTGNLSVTGDAIITGTGNTGTNRIRIGVNKNGDGATSTLKNIGIYSEDKTSNTIGKLQVNNFELGRKEVGGGYDSGMKPDKKYDYIRSNLKNSAFNNKDHSGLFNMLWTNGGLYLTHLFNNKRNDGYFSYYESNDYDS